jgi:hypothetical protein
LLDSDIVDNDCDAGGSESGSDGGGLWATTSDLTIAGCRFVDNTAGDGAGLYLDECSGSVRQTLIAGNNAADAAPGAGADHGGGGVLFRGGSMTLSNVVVQDNGTADMGGGLLFVDTGGAMDLKFLTVLSNDATSGGAGIHLDTGGSFGMDSTIIAYNAVGAGIDATDPADVPDLRYSDVYGNSAGDYGANVTDLTGTAGNVSGDPLFLLLIDDGNPDNDDLHLGAGSVCIDSGDASATDVDGSRADMGAYGGPYGAWP